MKTIGISLLVGVAGYAVGVLLGMVAVNLLSANQHDKAVEAAMTGFCFVGPGLAILAIVVFVFARTIR
ncbi:MAG: hypothetical protein DWI57_15850 [Chloroflexi bacterium]|nr:MAG: hypothetical protein DWI57_15850 [Chloroflexota bacterium]